MKLMNYRLLVREEKVEEKIGNVFIPDEHRERQQMSSQIGTVLSLGENCFKREVAGELKTWSVKPKVGDRIMFSKFSGSYVDGKEQLRCIEDEDVWLILEEGDNV